MSGLALWTLLKRVPSVVWAVLACAIVGVAIVKYAEHRGAEKVRAEARADTTRHAIAALDIVKAVQAGQVAQAIATKPATVTTGKKRSALRARVEIVSADTLSVDGVKEVASPVVVALIAADDAKVAADALHAAPADSVVALVPVVEQAHAAVDTALTHQITAGDGGGGHAKPVLVVFTVVGAAVGIFTLLHH